MKLSVQQAIFAKNLATFITKIFDQGYSCTYGEVYRTKEQADWYYSRGMGIKNSLHCKRLAVDLNIFDKDGALLSSVADYKPFGDLWCSLHEKNRWGGIFSRPDANHFEQQEL